MEVLLLYFLLVILVLASLFFVPLVALFRSRRNAAEIEMLLGAYRLLENKYAELQRDLRSLQERFESGKAKAAAPPEPGVSATPAGPRATIPEPVFQPEPVPAGEIAPPAFPTPPAPEPQSPVAPPKAAEAPPAWQSAPPPPPIREPAPRPAGAPARPVAQRPAFDWEGLVGVKLFSWIAGVALLLAAVFFLRYSIDRGWLMPPVRVAIGVLVGIGLLVLCELRAARKYPTTANAMDASAIAILFATFFAAHALWNLIGTATDFVLLVAVTAVAVFLSIRRDSVFIALLGLLGGFSTPALLSTGENQPVPLFGYLLLLNAGLAWISVRKNWAVLSALSLVLTTLYQWVWVAKFLTSGQLPLAGGIFLVFPVLSFSFVAGGSRRQPLYAQTATLSAALPLLFAVYMAGVPGYGAHYAILFGFLFLVDAGLFAIAAARGSELLHLAGGVSTLLVCAIWLMQSYESGAWPAVLGVVSVFVLFYLVAPLIARRFGRAFTLGSKGAFTAPLLLFTFTALLFVEPRSAAPELLFGVLFLLVAAIALSALLQESGALYVIAAMVTLTAEAVWSSIYLTPARLVAAVVMYGAFGLLYLGVPVAARRWNRKIQPGAGAGVLVLLSLAGHLFLFVVASQSALALPPWPLLITLLVLDLAAGGAALYTRRHEVHLAALAASLVLLMVWVVVAAAAPWPKVAILSGGAAVVLSLAWISLGRQFGIPAAPCARTSAVTLVLAQFLTIIASQAPGSPGLLFILSAQMAFLAALLALAWGRGWHALAVVAVAPAAAAVSIWQWSNPGAEFWREQLLFATPVYLAFVCYPLLLGRRAGRAQGPYLAAVLASVAFFFQARHALMIAGFESVIGALPAMQAIVTSLLLVRLQGMEPPGERTLGRLALVAGTALAFVTVAIPLQLEKEWITVGWALEGAALAWLYGKVPHRGLLYAASGLLAAVFVRLALNPSVLVYESRGDVRIWNWYLYTYLVCAAAFILAGRLLSKTGDELIPGVRASALLPAGATVLLFLLLNIEIADYYSVGPTITFNFSATLAQDLTYTLGWAVFAVGLLATGIAVKSQAARVAAISLLVVTVLKCFMHDLSRLGGLYRVGSFVGLALCLALVALGLQKFVLSARKEIR